MSNTFNRQPYIDAWAVVKDLDDVELIKLAAFSVCAELRSDEGGVWYVENGRIWHWHPLSDSGLAFDLAVKLQLIVHNEHLVAGFVYCTWSKADVVFPEVKSKSRANGTVTVFDRAATRRAIVTAAAIVGWVMKLEGVSNEPT